MSDSNGGDDAQDFASSRAEFVFGDDEDEFESSPARVSTNESVSEDLPDELLSYSDDTDLYALLGLSQRSGPSDADINAAYHRLSVLFHPDKHPASQQDIARQQFERIQKARDTLLDPEKRSIYDLLGEEGLEKEYGIGGSMRHSAKGRRDQVGPKAMNAKEFREWFIKEMKKRERTTLRELVNSRSGFILGINAISVFPSKTNPDQRRFALPNIRVSSFFLRSSFKIPFKVGVPWSDDSPTGSADVKEQKQRDSEQIEGYLNLYAGLGGPLRREKRTVDVKDIDTGEVEKKSILLPPSITARSFSLGTTAIIQLPDLSVADSNERWTLKKAGRRLVNGGGFEIGSQFLPLPSCRLAFARAFTPVSKANPFWLRVQTIYNYLPYSLPPLVNVNMSRTIGKELTGYCAWNSGTLFWPPGLIAFLAPILPYADDDPKTIESSSFSLGFTGSSDANETSPGSDDRGLTVQPAGESWGCEVAAGPGGGNLTLTYGRNCFRGQVSPPRISEWSFEGRHKVASDMPDQINAVRLEIETSVSLEGSLTWSVRGNRKFGDFTKAGVGIGVQGARGLVVSLTWSRLGQSISLPIAVCPLKLVEPDLAVAAIAIPWLTYTFLFHGILKRRANKRHREALRRKRHELEKHVSSRRIKSQQAVALMTSAVQRRQEKEAEDGGLVIICAQYGPCHETAGRAKTSANGDAGFIDVTLPLAALVHDSQLILPKAVTKSQLVGFYDPAPMKRKILRLWYRYDGIEHFVEFQDTEDLVCPLRSHQK